MQAGPSICRPPRHTQMIPHARRAAFREPALLVIKTTLAPCSEGEKQEQSLAGQVTATIVLPLRHHTSPARSTRSCAAGFWRPPNSKATMLWPLLASALCNGVLPVYIRTTYVMHANGVEANRTGQMRLLRQPSQEGGVSANWHPTLSLLCFCTSSVVHGERRDGSMRLGIAHAAVT